MIAQEFSAAVKPIEDFQNIHRLARARHQTFAIGKPCPVDACLLRDDEPESRLFGTLEGDGFCVAGAGLSELFIVCHEVSFFYLLLFFFWTQMFPLCSCYVIKIFFCQGKNGNNFLFT